MTENLSPLKFSRNEELTSALPDYYNMNHEKRGMFIILNHTIFKDLPQRGGTEEDVEKLYKVSKLFGFDLFVHNDLTTEEIKTTLAEYSQDYHRHCVSDCLIIAVLTHGGTNGLLSSKNGHYHQSLLWKPFLSHNCPPLTGKPKIIFIQACRGDVLDQGVTLQVSQTDSDDSYYKIPPEPDFCIFYSTFEGYYSWRNKERGSWFVSILSEELGNNDNKKKDFMELILRVTSRMALEKQSNNSDPYMAGKKQIPSLVCTLTKNIYFEIKEYN